MLFIAFENVFHSSSIRYISRDKKVHNVCSKAVSAAGLNLNTAQSALKLVYFWRLLIPFFVSLGLITGYSCDSKLHRFSTAAK